MSEEEIIDTVEILENTDISRIELAENVDLRTYSLAVNNLLDLYKQEKERLKIATAMLTKGTYPEKNEGDNDFNKKFIAVDKIKEQIEKYDKSILWNNADDRCYAMKILKELLEDR